MFVPWSRKRGRRVFDGKLGTRLNDGQVRIPSLDFSALSPSCATLQYAHSSNGTENISEVRDEAAGDGYRIRYV